MCICVHCNCRNREILPDEPQVDVDLFIRVLTFVYGEAQLKGRCAVVSSFRLRNELYGMPANEGVFRERIEKECVMRSSTYVGEIDLKPATLCRQCADRFSDLHQNSEASANHI